MSFLMTWLDKENLQLNKSKQYYTFHVISDAKYVALSSIFVYLEQNVTLIPNEEHRLQKAYIALCLEKNPKFYRVF